MTRTGARDWSGVIAAAPAVELPELLAMLGCHADRPRLVVVAAHPDDETIGAGRPVAAWSRSLVRSPPCSPPRENAAWTVWAPGRPLLARSATDHRAAGHAAIAAAADLGVLAVGFPVWLTDWGDPNEGADPLWRLAARVANDVLWRSALQRFRTQLEPLDRGLGPGVPPSTMLEHHTEQLLLAHDPRAAVSQRPQSTALLPRLGFSLRHHCPMATTGRDRRTLTGVTAIRADREKRPNRGHRGGQARRVADRLR